MSKYRISISFVVIVSILMCMITGCDLEVPDSSDETVPENESVCENTIIQNGHIDETYGDDVLVSPCCFLYGDIGVVVETVITSDLPDFCTDVDEIESGKYLILHALFVNASQSYINAPDTCFTVSADGSECEFLGDQNSKINLELPPDIQADNYYCFAVPDEYTELLLEYDRVKYNGSVVFSVLENGEFSDEDLESIYDSNGVNDSDSLSEYVVPIVSAESDSFYSSSSNNTDYTVDFTYDGDYSTCWQDGSEGDGIGEVLQYQFDPCDVYDVRVVNGNRLHSGSYSSNNRLENAMITFYLDDEVIYETEMLFVDDEAIEDSCLWLDEPIYCDSISLEIQSVYEGASYDDTGISEVSFISRRFTPLGLALYLNFPGADDEVDPTPVVCEYVYVCQFRNNDYPGDPGLNYDLYYLFDTDTNKVYSFLSTCPTWVDEGTYTGTITSSGGWGIEVVIEDYWQYISGSSSSIDVSDETGYCCYGTRVDSASVEAMISLPQ